ncbi:MAG: AAA family ATPase [Candidatus Omnitrophica bacterium]|nr:AAA family ATPase [Candidatus Omnitrophota bacterium]
MKKAGKIIAVAGKGGVGKSTIAALLVRYLVKQKIGSVLAVDADPNSNLGDYLGFSPKQDIGRIIDEISKNINQVPVSMSKDEFISYRIETTLDEADGFDLLTLGRPEGSGCYCYANNVLRTVLLRFMSSYDYIVIDNEAGFEHLSRKTVKQIDALIIVSDNTGNGLKAARRTFELVNELQIKYKNIYLLVNKADVDSRKKIEFPAEVIGFTSNNMDLAGGINSNVTDLNENTTLIKETNEIFSLIFERSESCLKS